MKHLNSEIIKEIRKENPELAKQFMKAKWPEFVKLKNKHIELWEYYKNI